MPSKSLPPATTLLIATEEKVHAFDLSDRQRVSLGRHASNDLVLPSLTVSNFHAELLFDDGLLAVRDLGSTNGTDLNGERVERASVASGDRVRIGNHVLTITLSARLSTEEAMAGGVLGPGARGRLLPSKSYEPSGPPGEGRTDREETDAADRSLADLLRGLTAAKATVRVAIEGAGAQASILFYEGSIIHAEYGDVRGEKALYRLFGWREARYEVEPFVDHEDAPLSICLPVEALLAEGVEHALELGKVVARLPPLGAPLTLKEDCPLPLTEHSHAEIEVFQEIIRHRTIEQVLAHSLYTDLRVLRLIESLLRKGVFEVGSDQSLHATYRWDTASLLDG